MDVIVRLLLPLAVCAPLAVFAGAEEGAYPVLLSMGRAAATDRGPQGGEPPYDRSGARRSDRVGPMRGRAFVPLPSAAASAARSAEQAPMEAAMDAASSSGSEPTAAASPAFSSASEAPALNLEAARMKRWAMRFFRLAPSTRHARSGRAALPSRGGGRASRATAGAGQEAATSLAGVRRGFAELLAAASCDLP